MYSRAIVDFLKCACHKLFNSDLSIDLFQLFVCYFVGIRLLTLSYNGS